METGLTKLVSQYTTSADRALITRAANFAKAAHAGQTRASGDPYFSHPLQVGESLARLGADATTVAAGLLHDTIEDTTATAEDIRREFGDEILFLVDGVTKLGHLKYQGLKRHVETLRKLFIATAKDPRVILIKLADRHHNLVSIAALPPDRQKRIAEESLEIYAPLAHRLGIGQLKGELEDLAFKVLKPKEFTETQKVREERGKTATKHVKKVENEVRKLLADARINVISIDYRIKHLWSLHKKLHKKEMNPESVYDIAALRIIVPTLEECYLTLGLIHSMWTPLPGRIKDYIAMPKANGYQSLHTTVFTGGGNLVEIQIRTKAMHDVAELGIASHVGYKERPAKDTTSEIANLRALVDMPKAQTKEWLSRLATAHKDEEEGDAYFDELKTDFFGDRILVFTPDGEVVDLPDGATPIDFAYAIHSDLGDHASGARVNGKFVALSTPLKYGDIVFIETKDTAKPTKKWVEWVKTADARRKIRSALGIHE